MVSVEPPDTTSPHSFISAGADESARVDAAVLHRPARPRRRRASRDNADQRRVSSRASRTPSGKVKGRSNRTITIDDDRRALARYSKIDQPRPARIAPRRSPRRLRREGASRRRVRRLADRCGAWSCSTLTPYGSHLHFIHDAGLTTALNCPGIALPSAKLSSSRSA